MSTIPTLKFLNDNELVENVKNDACNDSFEELICRHENLYYSTCHRFYKKHTYCNLKDLLDDLYIVFNKAIEKFDPNRNVKFSTFVAHYCYWNCLNTNKNTHKTIITDNYNIDLLNEKNNKFYTFKENQEELNEEIFKILNELDDKRISEIYKLRYIIGNNGNKIMSFNDISKKLNLSLTYVTVLHRMGKKYLCKKLNKNNLI